MENIFNFLADYSTAIHIVSSLLYIYFGIMIARAMPPKKPKTFGTLHVIHYPNKFKELYLELSDDIENFERNDQVCFSIKNENIDAN